MRKINFTTAGVIAFFIRLQMLRPFQLMEHTFMSPIGTTTNFVSRHLYSPIKSSPNQWKNTRTVLSRKPVQLQV